MPSTTGTEPACRSFLNHLRFTRRFSIHTLTAYTFDLNQFVNFVKRPILFATEEHVQLYLLYLKTRGYSSRSVKRKLEVLKSFYRYHLKFEGLADSPCKKISKLKFSKPTVRFIPEPIIHLTLDSIDPTKGKESLRDRLMLELLYTTGLRSSELLNIKTTDIDLLNAHIKVTGKRKWQRLIPLSSRVQELIQVYNTNWKTLNESEFLFCTKRGQKVYPVLLWRIVRKYFQREKLKFNVSAYTFRHSAATHMYHNHAPLEGLKIFLGHRSVKSTLNYLHVDTEHLKRVHQRSHPKEKSQVKKSVGHSS